MYDTNCHMTNHNVETFRVKRKEYFISTIFEVIIQQIKVQRLMKYSCHICGDTGHKIIDCLKYNDMHNMFKYKRMNTTNKQVVVKPKVSIFQFIWWMSTWPLLGAKLLKNKCSRIEN